MQAIGLRPALSFSARPYVSFGAAPSNTDNEYAAGSAIGAADIDRLTELLDGGVDAGTRLHYDKNRRRLTLLMHTAFTDDQKKTAKLAKIAKLLIERGASQFEKDHNGKAAIHIAAEYGQMNRVIRVYLENDTTGELVNFPDDAGRTALHHAARKGQSSVIKLLLKHRANPELKTNKNQDAKRMAQLSRNAKAIAAIDEALETRCWEKTGD